MTKRTLFLVTGPPGIGKTTCLRTIAEKFDPTFLAGFYCSERLIEGRRAGFNINMLSGEVGLLAAPEIEGYPRFGSIMPNGMRRLGVTLDFLEKIVCPSLLKQSHYAKLVLIDEIGPMQAASEVFKTMIKKLFCGQTPILASIALSDDPWISQLRKYEGDQVFQLNHSNREITSQKICSELKQIGIPRVFRS